MVTNNIRLKDGIKYFKCLNLEYSFFNLNNFLITLFRGRYTDSKMISCDKDRYSIPTRYFFFAFAATTDKPKVPETNMHWGWFYTENFALKTFFFNYSEFQNCYQ